MTDGTETGVMDIPDSITVPLSKPIEAHGQTVSEITLRAPTLGDMGDLGIGAAGIKTFKEFVAAVSRLGNIPPSSARSVRMADFKALNEAFASFLGAPPETGDT